MRSRPSALRGLKPVTREPWAVDEEVYHKKVDRREENARYQDKTARAKYAEERHTDYMARFDQKYSEMNGDYDRFDGNPFT